MHEFMYVQNGKSQRINETVRRSPIDGHGSHGNSRRRQLSGIKFWEAANQEPQYTKLGSQS